MLYVPVNRPAQILVTPPPLPYNHFDPRTTPKSHFKIRKAKMTPPALRSSVLVSLSAVLLLLALGGCGGGSGGTSSCGLCGGGGGNPTSITITFSGTAPTAIATQIGAGSFAGASLASGKLTVSVPSGTTNYAVAYACPPVQLPAPLNQQYSVHIWEAAISDGTAFSQTCANSNASASNATLTGTVDATAISGTNSVNLLAFNSTTAATGAVSSNSGSFSFAAPAGADRVEALAYDSNFHLLAAKDLGSQSAPGVVNSGSPITFASADQVSAQPVTYSGVPSGFVQPNTYASILLGTSAAGSLSSGNISQYPALPAGALENGDTYSLISIASATGSPSRSVSVLQTFTTAQPVSVTFPAPFTPVVPTPAAWPTFSIQYSGFSTGSIFDAALYLWNPSPTNSFEVSVTSTAAHQGTTTTVAIPDLSSFAGFPSAPASGSSVSWSTAVVQSSYPPGLATPLNATLTQVVGGGTYTVP
jgi:hypothetical protein